MEVRLTTSLPSEWETKTPLEIYETQFLYIGLSRYNTAKKTLSSIVRLDNTTLYTETPSTDDQFARCYVTEYATVTVYSHSPRVWKEDLGVDGQTFFVQHQPTHVS